MDENERDNSDKVMRKIKSAKNVLVGQTGVGHTYRAQGLHNLLCEFCEHLQGTGQQLPIIQLQKLSLPVCKLCYYNVWG